MKESKIMKDMREIIETDLEKDYECDFSNVSISPEIYNKIKNAAAETDKQYIERKRKTSIKRFIQVAACFIAVFTVITITVPDVATAMKALLFNVTVDEEAGGISLTPDKDFDAMREWDSYYYPEYLPEGFELEMVDDEYGKEMTFLSEDNDIVIIIKQHDLNVSIGHDVDTSSVQNLRINGWNGYLFVDKEHQYVDLIMHTDVSVVELKLNCSTDEKLLIKIAENLVLKNNKNIEENSN